MSHYRMLTDVELATPPIPCARCRTKSYAAGRSINNLCLICWAFLKRQAGA